MVNAPRAGQRPSFQRLLLGSCALLLVLFLSLDWQTAGAQPPGQEGNPSTTATTDVSDAGSDATEEPDGDQGDSAVTGDTLTGDKVTVVVSVVENKSGKRTAIEGVKLQAVRDGEVIDETETDAQGKGELVAEKVGTFEVRADPDSLPEGKAFRRDPVGVIDANRVQERTTYNFPVGAGQASDGGISTARLIDTVAKGLKFGLILGMTSVGLSLVFGTTGLTNFAHGELVTLGAVSVVVMNNQWRWPVLLALPLILAIGGLAGAGNEVVVFQTLRDGILSRTARFILTVVVVATGFWFLTGMLGGGGSARDRWILTLGMSALIALALVGIWRVAADLKTSLVGQLVVSIGLSIFYRYLLYLPIGGRTQFTSDYNNQKELGWIPYRPIEIWVIVASALILLAVAAMLQLTRLGKAIRAVADNRPLAAASGINVKAIILVVWIVGGALAALGGVFQTLTDGARFDTGGSMLLLMFAGVTLGGLGTAYGALLGSICIGLLVQISTLWLPNEMKNLGALAAMILILIFRPQGLLGKSERVG